MKIVLIGDEFRTKAYPLLDFVRCTVVGLPECFSSYFSRVADVVKYISLQVFTPLELTPLWQVYSSARLYS